MCNKQRTPLLQKINDFNHRRFIIQLFEEMCPSFTHYSLKKNACYTIQDRGEEPSMNLYIRVLKVSIMAGLGPIVAMGLRVNPG